MENFEDHPRTLSFASLECNVNNKDWEPFVSPTETSQIQEVCSEESVNHISCKNPDVALYIEDVQGLELDVNFDQTLLPKLPKMIHTLEKSFIWSDPSNIEGDAISISLGDIFTNPPRKVSGILRAPKRLNLNKKILQSPMFLQKTVILNMSAQDVLIESLWMQQNNISIYSSLYQLGFRFATTPNFSVFAGECPLGHRINQKKSLVFGKGLQKAGITAIPHVYIINDSHLEAYITYLKRFPTIKTIIMNCTLQRKSPLEIQHVHKIISRLILERKDLHIILQGINIKDARYFCEFEENLHYMVSTAHYNAVVRNENKYGNGKLETIRGSSKNRGDLIKANTHAYAEFIENVCVPIYRNNIG